MKDVGGSYFTFSNENNDLIWGFLAECHRRGLVYKGHDTMPWCARCGTGLSEMEMNEGYARPRGPGPDRPLPARRPARRGAPRLDDDALDADRERRGGRRARTSPTSWSARARRLHWLAKGTLKTALAGPVRGRRGAAAARTSSAGATRARSTTCRRSGPAFAKGTRDAPDRAVRASRRRLGRGRRGRGDRASSTSRPAAARRTSRSARSSACRSSPRSTRAASSSTASAR